jgi:nucleotidyltransferase/DNA polymerase involved in DNA repair
VSSDFCSEDVNADTKVVGISKLDGTGSEITLEPFNAFPLSEDERWLSVGAAITREIRKTIFDELGYTCSVGIATNKLVAKHVSPLNKPDGQTVRAVALHVIADFEPPLTP